MASLSEKKSQVNPKILTRRQVKTQTQPQLQCSCSVKLQNTMNKLCQDCHNVYKQIKLHLETRNPQACLGWEGKRCQGFALIKSHYNITDVTGEPILWSKMKDFKSAYYKLNIGCLAYDYCDSCSEMQRASLAQERLFKKQAREDQKSTNQEWLSSLPLIGCLSKDCFNDTRYDKVKDEGYPYCKECNRRYKFRHLPCIPCANRYNTSIYCRYMTNYDAKSGKGAKYCNDCTTTRIQESKSKEDPYHILKCPHDCSVLYYDPEHGEGCDCDRCLFDLFYFCKGCAQDGVLTRTGDIYLGSGLKQTKPIVDTQQAYLLIAKAEEKRMIETRDPRIFNNYLIEPPTP